MKNLPLVLFAMFIVFSSCKRDEYTCVCIDNVSKDTVYVSEYNKMSKFNAKKHCNTYDSDNQTCELK